MASTKYLIVAAVLVAGANAAKFWDDKDNDAFFKNPFKIQMPVPPVPPTPPRLPFGHFQPFRPFAPFPPFPPFGQNMQFPNFPNFPNFPHIPPPRMITPEEIRNAQPGPNQMFTGTVVKSQSSVVMDKDGKPVRKIGTSILTNLDGNVREYQEGNAPPDINKPIQVGQPWIPKMDFPEMPKMDFPKMHKMDFPEFGEFPKMKKFKMPKFEPITFKPFEPITFEPIVIEPIDVDKMKTYTPKDGEQYVAMSSSSHSSSKTVNGKTVSQGGSEMIVNDNGEVSQEGAVFKAGDPDV